MASLVGMIQKYFRAKKVDFFKKNFISKPVFGLDKLGENDLVDKFIGAMMVRSSIRTSFCKLRRKKVCLGHIAGAAL
jgi:hypothetical protein